MAYYLYDSEISLQVNSHDVLGRLAIWQTGGVDLLSQNQIYMHIEKPSGRRASLDVHEDGIYSKVYKDAAETAEWSLRNEGRIWGTVTDRLNFAVAKGDATDLADFSMRKDEIRLQLEDSDEVDVATIQMEREKTPFGHRAGNIDLSVSDENEQRRAYINVGYWDGDEEDERAHHHAKMAVNEARPNDSDNKTFDKVALHLDNGVNQVGDSTRNGSGSLTINHHTGDEEIWGVSQLSLWENPETDDDTYYHANMALKSKLKDERLAESGVVFFNPKQASPDPRDPESRYGYRAKVFHVNSTEEAAELTMQREEVDIRIYDADSDYSEYSHLRLRGRGGDGTELHVVKDKNLPIGNGGDRVGDYAGVHINDNVSVIYARPSQTDTQGYFVEVNTQPADSTKNGINAKQSGWNGSSEPFVASEPAHIITKKYLDDAGVNADSDAVFVQLFSGIDNWVWSGVSYDVGDVVLMGPESWADGPDASGIYRCIKAHTSNGSVSAPGVGGQWKTFWTPALASPPSNTPYRSGFNRYQTYRYGDYITDGNGVHWTVKVHQVQPVYDMPGWYDDDTNPGRYNPSVTDTASTSFNGTVVFEQVHDVF